VCHLAWLIARLCLAILFNILILILIRLWDSETWQLSDRIEIIVDKNEPLIHIALKIYEKNKSIDVINIYLVVIKAMSSGQWWWLKRTTTFIT
jgi:hypothetical protein